MPSIESWLAARGLSLNAASVQSALQIQDPQALSSLPLDEPFTRLDQAAGAPHGRALAYAREGELDKAVDLLQRAVALQPLHLPARLLQSQLQVLQQDFAAALDSTWDLLNAFSCREDLVPPLLYRAFLAVTAATLPRLEDAARLDLHMGSEEFHVRSAWCTQRCLAVEWTAHWEVLFAEWDSFAVSAYSWDGRQFLATDSGRWTSVAMLTNDYLVDRQKADAFRIVDLATERELPDSPLNEALFRALFLPRDRELASTELYRRAHCGAERLAANEAAFGTTDRHLDRSPSWQTGASL